MLLRLRCAPCQVALISPFLRELVLFDGAGTTHEAPLQLPNQVGALQACPLWAACDPLRDPGAGRAGSA